MLFTRDMKKNLSLILLGALLGACGGNTLEGPRLDSHVAGQDAAAGTQQQQRPDLALSDSSAAPDSHERAAPRDGGSAADTAAPDSTLNDSAVAPDLPATTTARYLSEDFEDDGWKSGFRVFYEANVTREGGVAARSGQYGIRMNVKAGNHWGGAIFFDHARNGQVGNLKEIWARYYIRFGPNWRRNDYRMGKAGYRARSDEVCGAPCLEMTDSHHLDETTGKIRGRSYFHRNVSDADLANKTFSYKGRDWIAGSERERERWYCVETHHVLNTPGQNDGVYQNWLDGALVSDQQSIRQRDSATFDIDHSVLITYIGGDWVADREMNVYYDDWAVSDRRIGCL